MLIASLSLFLSTQYIFAENTKPAPKVEQKSDKAESSKPDVVVPKTDGRAVYVVNRKVITLPEGMEMAPKDYKGAIGHPLALLKIKDQIIAEIYSMPLADKSVVEAEGMANSAKKSALITLISKETIKCDEEEIELVSLKLTAKPQNTMESPWVIHSLYYPRNEHSTGFKLIVSEKNYESALPYFNAMLGIKKTAPPKSP